MKFKIDNVVRIKEGIIDPDTGLPIVGWVGRITAIDAEDEMLELEFDSITLKEMPESYIMNAIDEGCDYFRYWIEASNVEPVAARDQIADTRSMQKKLSDQYYRYEAFGEEADYLDEILGDSNDEMENYASWMVFLEEKLQFPFQAVVTEPNGKWPTGHRMKVLDLNDYFDGYGIIADCKDEDGHLLNFTLCDLQVEDEEHPNWAWVHRYVDWFTNR